jgi:hypothetical protein
LQQIAQSLSVQMTIPVATLALVTHLAVAIADEVPHFDLEPVCRGVARQGGLALEPGQSARRDFESCTQSEMAIREQLVKQWLTFKAADKANCIGEATAGGMPSYTDLLTCLQMARDVNKIGH